MLIRQHNLTEYFREMIDRAVAKLDLPLAENSQYYLVNKLNDFRRTEKLFAREEDRFEDVPLAILLERAVNGSSTAVKIKNLQYLGDMALYIAGFYPDRTKRRHVTPDYYIGMGSGAYLSLAQMFNNGDTFSEIYEELGEKFPSCVAIVAEVKRLARGQCNEDLLAIYERWLVGGDAHLERILNREGISTSVRKRYTS